MARWKPYVPWRARQRHYSRGIVAALGIGLALSLMSHFGLFHGIQLKSTDLLFGAAAFHAPEPPADLVIVAIDDESLDKLGHYSSWSRCYHAALTDILASYGARVIAFDVLFSEPTPDDEALVASVRSAGNVVVPVVYASSTYSTTDGQSTVTFRDVLNPLQALQETAVAVGHANLIPDDDGIVRRVPITISSGTGSTPALSLAVLATYLRRPSVIESAIEDNSLAFAGRSIPLDSSGSMLINYTGDSAAPLTFESVSYADVLAGTTDPAVFADKIVMIGATAVGLGDTFWTPPGRRMSGVEIHAAAVDTILTADFLKPAPATVTLVSTIALALICSLIVLSLRVVWATVGCALLGIGYCISVFAFFDMGLVMDTLYPPLAILVTFVGVNLHNVTVERLQRMEMTRTFGRYVSPPVVDTVLAALRQGELRLGGEERLVTVLFADVRGFTSITETTPVVTLVEALNRYLSVVIEAILKCDGMVNKLAGDSVLAIWNAPVELQGHATLAVRAAVSALRAIRHLQETEPALPRMDFGMGINTGKAVAGNMGSADRLEYSVVGDAVNTAARLADLAPGGVVWLGSETRELAEGSIKTRPLPPLSVRGKRDPVFAYEVMRDHDREEEGQGSLLVLAAR